MKRFVVGLVFLILLSSQLMAGWLIVEKREDRFGNFSTQSVFILDQNVRVENQTSTYIFHLDTKSITIIFPKQMSFWTGSHDSLRAELFRTVESQVLVMIEQLPEGERNQVGAEFDQMLQILKTVQPDSLLPENFKIEVTDSLLELGGYSCRKYLFVMDTVVKEELWITEQVQPYLALEMSQLNEMMRTFSKPTPLSTFRESIEWIELLKHGLVMKSVIPDSFGNSVMHVERVREAGIPPDFFNAPPDYRSIGITEVVGIMMGDTNDIKPSEGSLPKSPQLKNIAPSPFLKDPYDQR